MAYGSLLRQLQEAFIVRVAFYRSKEGGALSFEKLERVHFILAKNDEEAKRFYEELRRDPVDKNKVHRPRENVAYSTRLSQSLWEMIKARGRDEFESGHLASKALTPTHSVGRLGQLLVI